MKKPVCACAKFAVKMKNPCDGYVLAYGKDEVDEYVENLQATHYAESVDLGMANKKLQDEVAKLKAQMPRYRQFVEEEEFRKKLVDEYDGYVYEWKGKHYVATPYLNIFVKNTLYALWMSRATTAKNLVIAYENYDYLDCDRMTIKQETARTWMTCKLRTAEEWVKVWKKVQALCENYAKKFE